VGLSGKLTEYNLLKKTLQISVVPPVVWGKAEVAYIVPLVSFFTSPFG
jgi:hypothetical protein